jgi:alpha-glucosidase
LPFGGIFLSDNEVNEQCKGTCYFGQESPSPMHHKLKYIPTGRDIQEHTLTLDAVYADTYNVKASDKHNYYSAQEALITYNYMISNDYNGGNQRAFVVSRSSSIMQGMLDSQVNTAARWLENYSTIQDMSNSITDIMQQNIMGVTFSGANICGYHWNASPELCARWYKIGAFYPLAINHNSRDSSPQAPHDFSIDIKDEI